MKSMTIINGDFRPTETGLTTGRSEEQKQLIRDLCEIRSGGAVQIGFIKKNGKNRHIMAMLDVAEDQQEAGNRDLMVVWDCSEQGFKSINLNTVHQVIVGGLVFDIRAIGERVTSH